MDSFLAKWLFEKQAISFQSAFDAAESARRLSLEVKRWPFFSPFHHCLLGSVRVNKVSISRVIPFAGRPHAPVFYGKFQTRNGVTVLEGYFAASLPQRILDTFSLGFILFMTILFSIVVISGAPITSKPLMPQWQSQLFVLFIPLAMLFFNLFFAALGKRSWRKDIPIISQKIQTALDLST